MTTSYIPQTLVHAHLPCPPTVPNTIPELRIPTERDQADFDPEDGLFHEHALSFSYNSQLNVLARSTHNGYTLELRPLDTVYDPTSINKDVNSSDTIRIIFPERISTLGEGCIILSELDRRVYILVYTEGDVLYRLNFPLAGNKIGKGCRFGFTVRGNEDWVEEWEVPQEIVSAAGGIGCWKAIDELNVMLGCGDGGIVRLSRSTRGINGSWTAHHHRVSSRFRLPSLFSSAVSDEQVVSLASFEMDEDTTLLYAFSRDRKLRVWNTQNGNLLKTLDVKSSSKEVVLRGSPSSSGQSQSSVLPQNSTAQYIRIVHHPNPGSKISHLVIVFVPAPTSNSAGSFVVYRIGLSSSSGDISLAGERQCSASSTGLELRGFDVVAPVHDAEINSGWKLWAIWDEKGSIACESIVMDDIFQFVTVFNNQPVSTLAQDWQKASLHNETGRFDPAYFDNLLSLDPPDVTAPLDNSDISLTFIDHLFYPGRFSILSLTTALEEYIEQLPRNKAYAEIGQSFPSLAKKFERIVGCDLQMENNSQTGAPEVNDYRSKLKLQWLGVWARVRILDAGARWPLGSAVIEDQLVVITREGVSAPIVQDACALIHDMGQLEGPAEAFLGLPDSSLQPVYIDLAPRTRRTDAISVAAAGRHISKVLSEVNHDEHNGTAMDILLEDVNVYVAKPYNISADAKADEIWSSYFSSYLSEEDQGSVRRLLSESSNIVNALSSVLDLLASTSISPLEVINEEMRFSGIGNALMAANIAAIVKGRYDLAKDTLLVGIFARIDADGRDDIEEDFTRILYRAFTTYQRYKTLLYVSEQAADEAKARRGVTSGKRRNGDDANGDWAHVRGESVDFDSYQTSYSLLHSLLSRELSQHVSEAPLGEISVASTRFLKSTLSLDAEVWDNVPLQQDVRLAYDVLEDGHPTLAGTITTFYPESSGMFYVRARAYLDLGDIDEAVAHFEKAAAGCRDRSLESIVSSTSGPNGLTQYYRHVTKLFEDKGIEEPIVRFGNLALEATMADDVSVKDIWTKVFLASLSIGAFDKAYVTLTSTPHPDLKRDFLGQLISTMCEANQVGELLKFGFVGFQKEVENLLQFKARHSDPLRPPHYHQVLYSWHVTRGDYRSAADVMYQQAKRLEGSRRSKDFAPYDIGVRQGSSYLAAINALSLLDKRQAWLANPLPAGVSTKGEHGVKRRRVTSYIPEEEFGPDNKVLEVVTLADVRAEYAAVLARLQLATVLPDFFDISGVPLQAEELVGLFVQRGMFDEAQASASGALVDLSDFFTILTRRCVRLSQPGAESDVDSPSSAWLYKSSVTAHLQGPPSALAMRYLQTALTRHDSEDTNWKYRQIVAEEMFSQNTDVNSGWKMPTWLVDWEMHRDPEGWISRAVRWGWIKEAIEWSIDLLRRSTPPELLPKIAEASDLPWNLFDRVIIAAKDGIETEDQTLKVKVTAFEADLKRRLGGLEKIRLDR